VQKAPAKSKLEPQKHHVVWEPQPRQQAFIQCPCHEVGFGGARGGGKSEAVLGDFLSHGEKYGKDAVGLVLRRERTQLIELIERARQIYIPLGYVYRDVDKLLTGPKGERLRFAYLERDADAEAYQGHSYTRLYLEELTTFPSERPVNKLIATLRSGQGVPCQMKTTCNPGGPGHGWVKRRYHLEDYPQGMKVFNVDGRTRVFIPSKVADNKYLGDDYIDTLRQVGSDQLVRAWLDGDWSVVEGSFFDVWSEKNIIRPFRIHPEWLRFRAMDFGSAKPFSVGWYCVVGDDYEHEDGVLPRGALIRYQEWYGASAPNVGLRLTIEEIAEGILERTVPGDKFQYNVADPSMFSESGGPSLAERMFRKGVEFRPGDNKRVAHRGAIGGWDQVRARLKGDGERPMLYVFSTCNALIRTLPALVHDPDRPEDLDTSQEDHAADELRYACMSRPWIKTPEAVVASYPDPAGNMVKVPPRKWKVLSEMNFSEYEKAAGIQLGRYRKRKEIW
jgi:hypothetical protein